MNPVSDWMELARQGQTLAAIVAYRGSAGVGLGEAKEAVEEWLAANLPPSADYQRAMRVGRQVADRLTEYAARTGKELAYIIRVLSPSPAEHAGHSEILFAEWPEGRDGRDVIVEIELSGVPGALRRQTVLANLKDGARMVWVVDIADPEDRTVTIVVDPLESRTLYDDATLDGGDVLPGFACKVSDLFG
jgi:hypothetical protein